MPNENRESRFEELRRKARERLDQVREGIEREMGTSQTTRVPPTPPQDVFTPVEIDYTLETELFPEPEAAYEGANRSEEAWEQRVVVSSRNEPTVVPEPTRVGPTVTTAVAPVVHRSQQKTGGKTHGSPVARLLQRGNLREAIIAQEVLGKPLSMRRPQDDE